MLLIIIDTSLFKPFSHITSSTVCVDARHECTQCGVGAGHICRHNFLLPETKGGLITLALFPFNLGLWSITNVFDQRRVPFVKLVKLSTVTWQTPCPQRRVTALVSIYQFAKKHRFTFYSSRTFVTTKISLLWFYIELGV